MCGRDVRANLPTRLLLLSTKSSHRLFPPPPDGPSLPYLAFYLSAYRAEPGPPQVSVRCPCVDGMAPTSTRMLWGPLESCEQPSDILMCREILVRLSLGADNLPSIVLALEA